MWYVRHECVSEKNVSHAPYVIARHHYFLHRIYSNVILSRRYAVDHQALCLVLFQDYERVRR
jgi:hypothetical protein